MDNFVTGDRIAFTSTTNIMAMGCSNMPENTPSNQDALAFLKTLCVLYVEDNDEVREQLSIFLERRFGQVITATDGADGLRAFQSAASPPDLVVTDVRMPIMDGLTMTGHLRDLHPDVPVLVTTAHEETDFLLRAIAVGVDGFVVKPVDTRQLHDTLLKISDRLKTRAELASAQQQVQENEARYRAIFWTAMDAFCVFEWESRTIMEVNRAFQKLYGYSQEQLQDSNLSALFDQTQGMALADLIDDTVAAREPMIVRHLTAAKELFPVEMTIGQFHSAGQSFGLMAIRDARPRLENMEEQESVVDALELTIDALEGLLDR